MKKTNKKKLFFCQDEKMAILKYKTKLRLKLQIFIKRKKVKKKKNKRRGKILF